MFGLFSFAFWYGGKLSREDDGDVTIETILNVMFMVMLSFMAFGQVAAQVSAANIQQRRRKKKQVLNTLPFTTDSATARGASGRRDHLLGH